MTAKTALLHIGTPKTGTTSIQQFLTRAEATGSLRPYRYPLWRGDHNQFKLAWVYLPYERLPAHLREGYQEEARESYRRFLWDQLRSSRGALISWEGLGNHFAPSDVARLRSDLESLGFREFHILLYVRDSADMYLSRTNELLKSPHYRESVVDPVSFKYEFRRMAETWEEVFPGRLMVRRFPADPELDVLDDFADQLKMLLGIDLPRLPVRANATLSAEAMQILHEYRQTPGPDAGLPIPGLARLVGFLQRSKQYVPQNKPVLKESVADQVRANHRQDAEFLRSRHGVDLGLRHLGPVPVLARGHGWSPESILTVVDSDTVYELLLLLAHDKLTDGTASRPLPVRAAARAYRTIPPERRPAWLDDWLRSKFERGFPR